MPITRKKDSSFTIKEITEEDVFAVRKLLSSGLTYRSRNTRHSSTS
jgi:hypothetical protein